MEDPGVRLKSFGHKRADILPERMDQVNHPPGGRDVILELEDADLHPAILATDRAPRRLVSRLLPSGSWRGR
jgi:hypothetical protein